ncbi:major facilitator superfamily domain-containing protein [Mycena leptocephala]|nr:major facilitator superfamily domain-containing protein [Mycena leptocephala]
MTSAARGQVPAVFFLQKRGRHMQKCGDIGGPEFSSRAFLCPRLFEVTVFGWGLSQQNRYKVSDCGRITDKRDWRRFHVYRLSQGCHAIGDLDMNTIRLADPLSAADSAQPAQLKSAMYMWKRWGVFSNKCLDQLESSLVYYECDVGLESESRPWPVLEIKFELNQDSTCMMLGLFKNLFRLTRRSREMMEHRRALPRINAVLTRIDAALTRTAAPLTRRCRAIIIWDRRGIFSWPDPEPVERVASEDNVGDPQAHGGCGDTFARQESQPLPSWLIISQGSFTFDTWTSRTSAPYLGVTGHYIDAPDDKPHEWSLKCDQLSFMPLEAYHSGENLSKILMRTVDRYEIREKATSILLVPLDNLFHFQAGSTTPKGQVELTDQTNRLPFKKLLPIFAGLALCVVVSGLDSVIVATVIPTISAAFNAGSVVSWVPFAYLLTSTCFLPLHGRFSDIFGRKSALFIAMSLFMVGNLLARFSKTIIQVIVFRGLAGAGGGGLVGMSQIVISDIVSLRERGKYQGIISGVIAIGYCLGPVIGGAFAQKLEWEWCFWVTVPFSFLATCVVAFILPLKPVQGEIRSKLLAVDYVGTLLTLVGCTLFILPLIWGGVTFPWTSPMVLAPLLSAFVVVAIFCLWEWKGARLPIVPMVSYSSRRYPQFFQVALGYGPLHAGLFLIPFLVTQVFSSWGCSGPQHTLTAGEGYEKLSTSPKYAHLQHKGWPSR